VTPPRLTDAEFRAFQELIHKEAGIWLAPAKKALLVGRLSRRLRELGLSSFRAYFEHLSAADPGERVVMLDCITTNETRFFREPRQFDFLETDLLPAWTAAAAEGRRPRRIRAWSAGCSTGEEPYSLAMALLAQCPPSAGWDVEIVATDLSTRALHRAAEGVYPLEDAGDIPPALLKRFMLRGVRAHEGRMKAGPELREVVRFRRLNLNDGDHAALGEFDLVFCRNVLIYFDGAGKERVLARLKERVRPEGILFLGHSETLGAAEGFRGVRPNVYARTVPFPHLRAAS
jgi:chemotaxis protein methyltransferase CheR